MTENQTENHPEAPLFGTVLVANRGEIAVRVIRTLRRLGIRSVAVYSEADAGARHVCEADDAVCLGPAAAAESYLDIDAVVRACRTSGAQAVHPGYGFLSENLDFARALEDAGITFIGPSAHSINLMGDKIRAKNHVASHGVPVVPGVADPGMDDAALIEAADGVGFPLLIKPSAGGGGKGMHAVESAAELPATLQTARRVARSSFGDDTLLLERLVRSPRHIEVQVLADTHGNTIHLGERECSLQRRHQKVIEEAPAPLLEMLDDGASIRERIGAAAVDAARSVDYVGAGTVEFLVSDENPGEFFFMEMNTRLQVEHPVTEEVVRVDGQRIDLVEWQVRVAAGEALGFGQQAIGLSGHAIEARVYAEDPAQGFLPSIGTILRAEDAVGEGIRTDSGIATGSEVTPHYDPMLAKVIAHGADRPQALARLDAALASTIVLGVETNLEYLRALLAEEDVQAGRLDTTFIDRWGTQPKRQPTDAELQGIAARFLALEPPAAGRSGAWSADGWRLGSHRRRTLALEIDGELHQVQLPPAAAPGAPECDTAGTAVVPAFEPVPGTGGREAWIGSAGYNAHVRWLDRRALVHRHLATIEREEAGGDPESRSPMPGTVVSVLVATGDHVEAGQPVLAVEAMKMEHPLTAGLAGTVTVHVAVGDHVAAGACVATVQPDPEPTIDAADTTDTAAASGAPTATAPTS
ncbi:biotin carboxylase N-terminal domain-containing protein [Arthrobacter sp. JSM 101049]|uniref:acetyl/propionyl/methylcrotonyl-CoA carboxylase subunit alpha n=1 Tax=Arthrobacter sp. JSM 101049 TaxID=929097 RepID=UPI00356AE32C